MTAELGGRCELAESVVARDHDLTAADEDELTVYRREHVGFIFQFYNLIGGLTAIENVSLVAEISEDPLEPAEALRLVDLYDRKDHQQLDVRFSEAVLASMRRS